MDAERTPDTLKFKRRTIKTKLTKRTVEALTPPAEAAGKPSQQWTYDSTTPRLAICVWSSGARSWYWVGRCNGRMIRFKLGEFPEIAPEQARKLAAKTSADVASGVDPREARWRSRAEMLLGELLDQYLDHAKNHGKRTWEEDQKQFNRYCGQLKGRYLSSVIRADVAALHEKVGREHGKYAANRLLALLSKMFSFAAELGFSRPNPVKGIQRFRERSRDRFLSGDELQRLFAALQQEPPLFQDFFKVLLLTGARRSNVQAMRFDQLNLIEATWRIPETKNGEALTVHLTAEAAAILQRRLAESNGGPWAFPGGKKNPKGHLNSPKGAWSRVLQRAGLADLRMHDLRRTLGSWQAAAGASLAVIGKSLGHKSQAATAVYARLDLDPVRASVDAAVAAMMAAASPAKDAPVKKDPPPPGGAAE